MEKFPGAGTSGTTILIVDDEVGILEVVEFILSDAGFKVVSALNGQEALALLEKTKPDLVLADYMMPILDGASLIKAIRNDARFREIPVILTSALPEHTIKERCEGYNAFLRKPFKTETLMEEISRLLDAAKAKA